MTVDEMKELTRLRPDTAQWIDLRGFLFSGRCAVYANRDPANGFVVRSLDFPGAFVAGKPTPDVVRAVVADAGFPRGEWHVLAPPESVPTVRSALSGWRTRGVTLHTRPLDAPPPETPGLPSGVEIRVAARGWEVAGLDLGLLPSELLREYRSPAVVGRPMAAAVSRGKGVAFCYLAVETESLWDVAVDTVEGWRRRGLAAACVVALSNRLSKRGLRPVWGALDENVASMKLAAKLGFEPEAKLTSFVRPTNSH